MKITDLKCAVIGQNPVIRITTDEGIVVILDPRVTGKRYGRQFLEALPECPVEVVGVDGESIGPGA